MEINKQLFEDVLSGKLKGKFVLRNGDKFNSSLLQYDNRLNRPYSIGSNNYYNNGLSHIIGARKFDIVDFIPNTNMKENELTIEIPEGQEIDWQESAKQEKIVFKKKDTKPRSWGEYLRLNTGFDGTGIDWNIVGGIRATGLHHRGKAIVPTKYGAPFIAMMQLMSVRQEWIGDWEPDWKNRRQCKYCIALFENDEVMIDENIVCTRSLSFPTKEMAEDFMDCFKDLLNMAKPLI